MLFVGLDTLEPRTSTLNPYTLNPQPLHTWSSNLEPWASTHFDDAYTWRLRCECVII